jgi:hypothetical protein
MSLRHSPFACEWIEQVTCIKCGEIHGKHPHDESDRAMTCLDCKTQVSDETRAKWGHLIDYGPKRGES